MAHSLTLNWRKLAVVLAAVLILLIGNSLADQTANAAPMPQPDTPIYVSSNIATNTTWTPDNIYIVNQRVFVNTGITLTIQAGTIVKFSSGCYLDVFGKLQISGSPGNEVVFTSLHDDSYGGDTNKNGTNTTPAAGDWDAVYIENNQTTSFEYAIVRFARRGLSLYNNSDQALSISVHHNTFGENLYGMYLHVGNNQDIVAEISDNVFTNNKYGIGTALGPGSTGIATGSADPVLLRNTFSNNTALPIYLGGTAFPEIGPTNTFVGSPAPNKKLGIGISGHFTRDGTWEIIGDMPYVVLGNTTVENGKTITIPAGAIFKFARWVDYVEGAPVLRKSYLDVYGALNLQSTADKPITFTSVHDDANGGDTLGDGNDVEPFPGDWEAVYFYKDTSPIHHLRVRYATKGIVIQNTTGGNLSPTIQFNEFTNNVHSLYYLTGDGPGSATSQTRGTLSSNTFAVVDGTANQSIRKLTSFPIVLNGTAFPEYLGNSFSNHARPAIGLLGTWNYSGTWSSVAGDNGQIFPYVVMGNTLITNAGGGVTIDVPAGTVFKFDKWTTSTNEVKLSSLEAVGGLNLQSTGGSPIYFTSYRDDTIKGDTNFDGGATAPTAGDWEAVYLENNTIAFHDAVVRYAVRGASVYNNTDGPLTIPVQNCTFTNNTAGVTLVVVTDYDITSQITGNTFDQNQYGIQTWIRYSQDSGLYSIGAARPFLANNNFTRHSGFPLYLGGTAFPVYGAANVFSQNVHRAIGLGGTFANDGSLDRVIGDNGIVFPYVVTENLYIRAGTVTLPARTVVKSAKDKYIEVFSTLSMLGTSSDPITFSSYLDDSYDDTNADGSATTPAPGDWVGIYLDSSTTNFHHAVVKYSRLGVSPYNSDDITINPSITNSYFQYNTYGVYMYTGRDGAITSAIHNNQFLDNQYCIGSYSADDPKNGLLGFGIAKPDIQANLFSHCGFPYYFNGTAEPIYGTNNDYQNNIHRAIAVGGLWAQDATWKQVVGDGGHIFPYVALNTVYQNQIFLPSTITIPAGTVVKFNKDVYFYVSGYLDSQGTAANPVIYTSYLDDSVAGDTNADGSASQPGFNDWKTIWLLDEPDKINRIHNVIAKHATAAFGVYYDGPVETAVNTSIVDSTFQQNLVGVAMAIGYSNNEQCRLPGQGNINSALTNIQFVGNYYDLATYTHSQATGLIVPTLRNVEFVDTLRYPMYFGGTTSPVIQTGVTIKAPGHPNTSGMVGSADQIISDPSLEIMLSPQRNARILTYTPDKASAQAIPTGPQPAADVQISGYIQAIGLAGHFNNAAVLPTFGGLPYAINGNYPLYIGICNGWEMPASNVTIGNAAPKTSSISFPEGAVIKFGTGLYIDVFGKLDLLGTVQKPIVFTSLKDDSIGGDTNQDGGASFPAPGDWEAVYLNSSATDFVHAMVKYADRGLDLYFYGAPNTNIEPGVHNSLFINNRIGLSIQATSDGDILSEIHHNLFLNNGTHIQGYMQNGGGQLLVDIYSNDFIAPTTYGVNNLSTNTEIKAAGNYWGGSTGPYHPATNPGGKGVEVSDRVNYGNWLPAPTWDGSTYSISGRILTKDTDPQPLAGIKVMLSNGASVYTDQNGYFKFDNLKYGIYAVQPAQSGYAFSPASFVANTPPDAVTPTFYGQLSTATMYTASGRITVPNGMPVEGVFVSIVGPGGYSASTLTDSNGSYSFSGLTEGNYTITPSLPPYTFNVAHRNISIGPNYLNADFVLLGMTIIPNLNSIYLPNIIRR